jgi:hypothetical protein
MEQVRETIIRMLSQMSVLNDVLGRKILTDSQHFARIVHEAILDGHGYAFPYDDVTPTGGVHLEGAMFSYSPALLTVSVGGRNAGRL